MILNEITMLNTLENKNNYNKKKKYCINLALTARKCTARTHRHKYYANSRSVS